MDDDTVADGEDWTIVDECRLALESLEAMALPETIGAEELSPKGRNLYKKAMLAVQALLVEIAKGEETQP